jgi:hypothetical protein
MMFKQEFIKAWRAGQGHQALLALVRRHQTQGLAPQEAYRTLQQVWQEQGFDRQQESGALQDVLEGVMERIWYECPA